MAANPLRNATVEDYDSAAEESTKDTRKTANVGTKRSHPSDLGNDANNKPAQVNITDVASDSGYSSHTVATMGSADSGQSARSGSAPSSKVDERAGPDPTRKPARPTLDVRQTGSQKTQSQSPKKSAPARTASVSHKSRSRSEKVECPHPNCSECTRGRKHSSAKADSPIENTCRQYTLPLRDTRPPPSPGAHRPPQPKIPHAVPFIQQPAPPQRRPSVSSRASRPMSYHAGVNPEDCWGQGQAYNPYYDLTQPQPYSQPRGPPLGYQPPPVPQQAYSYLGATPPNQTFLPPPSYVSHSSPTSPYDQARPTLPSRPSDLISARRPGVIHGQPTASQGPTPYLSDTVPTLHPGPSARHTSMHHASSTGPTYIPDDSYSASEDEYYTDHDRTLMPPPPQPRRRSMHRSHTTSDAYSGPRITYPQPPPPPPPPQPPYPPPPPDDHRLLTRTTSRSTTTNASSSSRTSSNRRPSLASSGGRTKASSYSSVTGTGGGGGVAYVTTVESARPHAHRRARPVSYYGHEKQAELQADAEAYFEDVRQGAAAAAAAAQRRRERRGVGAGAGAGAGEGGRDAPLVVAQPQPTQLTAEALRRSSRGGGASDVSARSRTSRSSRDGGGGGSSSRVSGSHNRPKAVSISGSGSGGGGGGGGGGMDGGGVFRMRIEGDGTIELSGDMEGRAIQLKPREGGAAELIVGSSRREVAYASVRGSQVDGRSSRVGRGREREEDERSGRGERERERDRRRGQAEEGEGW